MQRVDQIPLATYTSVDHISSNIIFPMYSWAQVVMMLSPVNNKPIGEC